MLLLALISEWFIFWPLLLIFIVVGGWTAENEAYGWSGIMSALILALCYFAAPAIGGLVSSPIKIVLVLGAYIALGVVWSTFKWYLKLKNTLAKFKSLRDEYIRKNKLPVGFFSTPVSEESDADVIQHHKAFARVVRDAMCNYSASACTTAQEVRDNIQPKIWENKSRIVAWGVYWPTSVTWFIFNDFIREIINGIYNAVSGRLQAMSDAMFKNAL